MVKSIIALGAVALCAGVAVADDQYFTGDGTSYTLDSLDHGNCNSIGGHFPDDMQHYAALNHVQWGLAQCNRCAEVSCDDSRCSASLRNQTHIVHIIDQCPECLQGALDMSPTVFQQITGVGPNRYKIRWHFVDCPQLKGNIEYCLKAASHQWWGAVQVTNSLKQIASVQINDRPASIMNGAYYYVIDNGGKTIDYSSVKIAVTSTTGETVTDTVKLAPGGCTTGTHQFGAGGNANPAPATTAPAAPVTAAPVASTTAAPAVPATEAPAAPATEAPAAPATEAPASPATEAPAAPATEAPASPATDAPAAPATAAPESGSPASSAGDSDATPAVTPGPKTKKPHACRDKKHVRRN